jgi:hypothetical protein
VGALLLLLGFSVAIGLAMRRGERPDCGCFGSSSSSPIGPGTLARNAALAALAGIVAVAGGGAALGSIDASPLAIVLSIAFIGQAWFSWQLFRQHGRLLQRVRALEEVASATGHRATHLQVIHRRRRRSAEQRLRALER